MKKIILVLAALLVFGNVFSQGIKFEHGTFTEAIAKAKKENKMVFMDCYTTWCGPCKYLAKNIFTQDEVGSFFNKNFVNVKMDMESEAGKPLMEKYKIQAFPTLLWLDGNGDIQHKTVGAGDAKSLLETAALALDQENNWKALHSRYQKGERSAEFMQNYILTSALAGFDVKEASKEYFSAKKPEELINPKDAKLIMRTVQSTSDPIFHWVLKNRKNLYTVAEKQEIDQYLEYTMMRELGQLMRKDDNEAVAAKKKELTSLDKEIGTKVVAFMEVNMLQRDPDKQKFYRAIVDYAFKYDFENSQNLNRYAWMIAEAEEVSKELLLKALEMTERSVELDSNFANTDTYAFLLYKLGKEKEAKLQAKKSVQLAPEDQKKDLWSAKFLNGEL